MLIIYLPERKTAMKSTARAFTLIELLIVVAIIAILAAIAVPNFMEAQVRSKISRVKTDMRSIVTAIETYTVDNNVHPIGWEEGVVTLAIWNWDGTSNAAPYRQLTTPIAYMTSIPKDPFATFAKGSSESLGTYYHFSGLDDTYMTSVLPDLKAWGFTWDLHSAGPGAPKGVDWNVMTSTPMIISNNSPDCLYDSSNGTKSIGWLIRTNKGDGWEGCRH
jgi:type II secretion system protein G